MSGKVRKKLQSTYLTYIVYYTAFVDICPESDENNIKRLEHTTKTNVGIKAVENETFFLFCRIRLAWSQSRRVRNASFHATHAFRRKGLLKWLSLISLTQHTIARKCIYWQDPYLKLWKKGTISIDKSSANESFLGWVHWYRNPFCRNVLWRNERRGCHVRVWITLFT